MGFESWSFVPGGGLICLKRAAERGPKQGEAEGGLSLAFARRRGGRPAQTFSATPVADALEDERIDGLRAPFMMYLAQRSVLSERRRNLAVPANHRCTISDGPSPLMPQDQHEAV